MSVPPQRTNIHTTTENATGEVPELAPRVYKMSWPTHLTEGGHKSACGPKPWILEGSTATSKSPQLHHHKVGVNNLKLGSFDSKRCIPISVFCLPSVRGLHCINALLHPRCELVTELLQNQHFSCALYGVRFCGMYKIIDLSRVTTVV